MTASPEEFTKSLMNNTPYAHHDWRLVREIRHSETIDNIRWLLVQSTLDEDEAIEILSIDDKYYSVDGWSARLSFIENPEPGYLPVVLSFKYKDTIPQHKNLDHMIKVEYGLSHDEWFDKHAVINVKNLFSPLDTDRLTFEERETNVFHIKGNGTHYLLQTLKERCIPVTCASHEDEQYIGLMDIQSEINEINSDIKNLLSSTISLLKNVEARLDNIENNLDKISHHAKNMLDNPE